MNKNKASVTALCCILCSHCCANKNLNFQSRRSLYKPCVAAMSIYSAVPPSHEKQLCYDSQSIGPPSPPCIPSHDYSVWLTCNAGPSSPAEEEIKTDKHKHDESERDNAANECPELQIIFSKYQHWLQAASFFVQIRAYGHQQDLEWLSASCLSKTHLAAPAFSLYFICAPNNLHLI